MAVVKFGAIVTDMKGKLGGHVFQGSKGGSSLRTKAGKTKVGRMTLRSAGDPIPGIDMTWPTVLARVASSWRSLSLASKNSWDALVGTWTFTNKFGDVVNRNGYAIYTACNMNRVLGGLAILDDAPIPDSAFPMDAKIEFDNVASDILLTFQNAESVGQKFVLLQAGVTNKDKVNPATKYKIIHVGTIQDTNPQSIDAYVQVPPGFDLYSGEFCLFFQLWTYKANYPIRMGGQTVRVPQG